MIPSLTYLRLPYEIHTPLEELEMLTANGNCLAPVITDGMKMFIDPALKPRHGDYVALQLPENIEGTELDKAVKRYEIAIEPDGTEIELICNVLGRFRLVNEKILGVVVALVYDGIPSPYGALVDAATERTAERIRRMRAGNGN